LGVKPTNSVGGVVAKVTSNEVLGTGAEGTREVGAVTGRTVAAVAVDATGTAGAITKSDNEAVAVSGVHGSVLLFL
jgi:hypothetical protein